ncbi:MAG: RraA family protein [Anaerolineae bacterium]|nr:RraA family protein [Anaerolineae bacterium]
MRVQPSREDLIEMTKLNPFERFPDGRPRVPDELLERMKLVTTEEAWSVLRHHGYHRQFEGNWRETHPGQITVGRAVTAQFVPHRPDFHDAVQQTGLGEGRGKVGGQNSWIIETLQTNDVMVVDIFGKVKDGTVVGDNLGTAVRTRTRAGAVIDGGIRDYQGLVQLTDVNFYIRGVDPTAIADVTLAGLNIPIRIGGVTVLPGDVVLGTPTGVIFIPPHLAQAVVERSEEIRVRDEFGKQRLAEGKYTSGEIDVATWREDIEADFQAWKREHGR